MYPGSIMNQMMQAEENGLTNNAGQDELHQNKENQDVKCSPQQVSLIKLNLSHTMIHAIDLWRSQSQRERRGDDYRWIACIISLRWNHAGKRFRKNPNRGVSCSARKLYSPGTRSHLRRPILHRLSWGEGSDAWGRGRGRGVRSTRALAWQWNRCEWS